MQEIWQSPETKPCCRQQNAGARTTTLGTHAMALACAARPLVGMIPGRPHVVSARTPPSPAHCGEAYRAAHGKGTTKRIGKRGDELTPTTAEGYLSRTPSHICACPTWKVILRSANENTGSDKRTEKRTESRTVPRHNCTGSSDLAFGHVLRTTRSQHQVTHALSGQRAASVLSGARWLLGARVGTMCKAPIS